MHFKTEFRAWLDLYFLRTVVVRESAWIPFDIGTIKYFPTDVLTYGYIHHQKFTETERNLPDSDIVPLELEEGINLYLPHLFIYKKNITALCVFSNRQAFELFSSINYEYVLIPVWVPKINYIFLTSLVTQPGVNDIVQLSHVYDNQWQRGQKMKNQVRLVTNPIFKKIQLLIKFQISKRRPQPPTINDNGELEEDSTIFPKTKNFYTDEKNNFEYSPTTNYLVSENFYNRQNRIFSREPEKLQNFHVVHYFATSEYFYWANKFAIQKAIQQRQRNRPIVIVFEDFPDDIEFTAPLMRNLLLFVNFIALNSTTADYESSYSEWLTTLYDKVTPGTGTMTDAPFANMSNLLLEKINRENPVYFTPTRFFELPTNLQPADFIDCKQPCQLKKGKTNPRRPKNKELKNAWNNRKIASYMQDNDLQALRMQNTMFTRVYQNQDIAKDAVEIDERDINEKNIWVGERLNFVETLIYPIAPPIDFDKIDQDELNSFVEQVEN